MLREFMQPGNMTGKHDNFTAGTLLYLLSNVVMVVEPLQAGPPTLAPSPLGFGLRKGVSRLVVTLSLKVLGLRQGNRTGQEVVSVPRSWFNSLQLFLYQGCQF